MVSDGKFPGHEKEMAIFTMTTLSGFGYFKRGNVKLNKNAANIQIELFLTHRKHQAPNLRKHAN